jgi:hypothetical protein
MQSSSSPKSLTKKCRLSRKSVRPRRRNKRESTSATK